MRIKSTHPAFCTLRTSVNRINGPQEKEKPTTRISAGPEPTFDDFGIVRDDQSSAIECKNASLQLLRYHRMITCDSTGPQPSESIVPQIQFSPPCGREKWGRIYGIHQAGLGLRMALGLQRLSCRRWLCIALIDEKMALVV